MRPSPQVSYVITPRSGHVYRLIDEPPQTKAALNHQIAPEKTIDTVLIPRSCNNADIVREVKKPVQPFFLLCMGLYRDL